MKRFERTWEGMVLNLRTRFCLFAAFAAVTGAHAAVPGPCEQISAACESAGFVRGGVGDGNGLLVDCVAPIMRGAAHTRNAARTLPQIDPGIVRACSAADPEFGRTKAQRVPRQGENPAAATLPTESVRVPNASVGTRGARPPNIVFILTDDLAWNLVPYMPHVRQMQKDGVTFTNYFVTDSLCCPSRSSIFTGRYPHDTGIFRNTGKDGGYIAFRDRGHENATFATALAAAGYRTAMLGKYLNGYVPEKDRPAPGWTSWAVAGNGYREFNYTLNQDGKIVRYGAGAADYLTDVLSGIAVRFIKEARGSPFMIEVATFAPHAPYTPAPRDAGALPELRAPRTSAFDAEPGPDAPRWLVRHPALTPTDMTAIDRDFRKRAQSVLAVDSLIGELIAAVAAMGETDNTYFVFSSDNGYHMGEHRLMPGKMTAYDTDIHVPLIVTGPGVPAGRNIDAVTENVDLCPTFVELGGALVPARVDGRSLVRLFHGESVPDWRAAALVEHHGPHNDPTDPDAPALRSGNPPTYEALRTSTFTYVEYAGGEFEHHDLTADPDEMLNGFAALSPDAKATLHARLDAMKNCHDAAACAVAEREPTSHAK